MTIGKWFGVMIGAAFVFLVAFTAVIGNAQIDPQVAPRATLAAVVGGGQPAGATRPAVPRGGGPMPLLLPPTEESGSDAPPHLPLMIRWSNWRPEFGPALVYAREQDLAGLLRMEGPVVKMLMVTGYDEMARLMQRADELYAGGITVVGLNTENGLTPSDEMQTLQNPDPDVNLVARVARLATDNGFAILWGPVRRMVDDIGDDALRTMLAAGVRGVALQEQKFIEGQPAAVRITAVNQSMARYRRLAEAAGVSDFTFHVQIMHQRCPNMANCVDFVAQLEAIPVSSIAIWSNGPIPVGFVEAIRGR